MMSDRTQCGNRESSRDKFEIAIENAASENRHTDPELNATTLNSGIQNDAGSAAINKTSRSFRVVKECTASEAPSKSHPNERLDAEQDKTQYPSGIRLFCLTVGLMAAVLMVALDNYILGALTVRLIYWHTSLTNSNDQQLLYPRYPQSFTA